MAIGEPKDLCLENHNGNTLRSNKKSAQNKPTGVNATQSSTLSPQSFNQGTPKFEPICTELLRKGHHVKFSAPGDSMYPTICDGDVVTVVPVETESIGIGDIILYRHTSGVAAHRVIHIEKPKSHHSPDLLSLSQSSVLSPQHLFILRGDAAPVLDNPVSSDNILGKVTLVEREGRRIDPYCLRINIHYKTRRFASYMKRLLSRSNPEYT